jgi:hypothetical protein
MPFGTLLDSRGRNETIMGKLYGISEEPGWRPGGSVESAKREDETQVMMDRLLRECFKSKCDAGD